VLSRATPINIMIFAMIIMYSAGMYLPITSPDIMAPTGVIKVKARRSIPARPAEVPLTDWKRWGSSMMQE